MERRLREIYNSDKNLVDLGRILLSKKIREISTRSKDQIFKPTEQDRDDLIAELEARDEFKNGAKTLTDRYNAPDLKSALIEFINDLYSMQIHASS